MTDPKKANETLASSTYDQPSGHVSKTPETEGLATGPKDTVTGKVQETPDEPSDRPGTEAEEGNR